MGCDGVDRMVHTGNDFGVGFGMQPKHSVRSHTKPEVGRVGGIGETNAPTSEKWSFLIEIGEIHLPCTSCSRVNARPSTSNSQHVTQ